MTIEAVLFDFGRVLGYFSHEKACGLLAKRTNASADMLHQALFTGECLSHRQRGLMNGRELYELVRQRFALDPSCDFEEFAAIWGDIFRPAPPAVNEIIKRLRPDVFRCLATNTEQLHWPYIERLETFKLLQRFVFRSYKMRAEKPNPQFFKLVFNTLTCSPEQILFIDDRPENVAAFRKMGGQAEVFDLTEHDPSRLERILQTAGVLET